MGVRRGGQEGALAPPPPPPGQQEYYGFGKKSLRTPMSNIIT